MAEQNVQDAPQATTVVRMPRDPSVLTSPARFGWEPEQVEAIKHTVAKDCSPAEFVMFLELAARYKLDPFAKQIWAASMGQGKPVAILIGRDGLLTIAERHPEYEGLDSDVVCEKDTFKVKRGPGGIEVEHSYEGWDRGPVKGAWALAYRKDRPRPTYFFAPVGDYKPTGNKLNYSPWGKQESVMMLKCAQSTALRLAFNVSGLMVDEESQHQQLASGQQQDLTSVEAGIEWGDDERLASWLRALVARANEVKPGLYRDRKVQVLLRGRTDDERHMFITEVIGVLMQHGAGVPLPPEDLAALDEAGRVEWFGEAPEGVEVIEVEAQEVEPEPVG